ncbi:formate dehydrogenase subunit gamma, partial [Tritonibacter sp. SIMBA_163]
DRLGSEATGNPDAAAAINEHLGTLGGQSDPERWRALRYNSADIRVSAGGGPATDLVPRRGMSRLTVRARPVRQHRACP